MLSSIKDHWKKIAEDELYANNLEQEKVKKEQSNQFDWNRRYKEGKWLLKGVQKVDDSNLVGILDKKAADDKRNKYIPEEEVQKKKKVEKGAEVAVTSKPKTNYLKVMQDWMTPKEATKKTRMRNARFVIKEGIAQLLVQRDVENERDKFLRTNSKHIRVLQNVRLLLNRPRLPPHHCSTTHMKDSDPPMSAEIAAHIGELNLRTYHIPEKQRIIETLRSVDEVKNEEVERRKHWVPGRYHEYLGLHRIFALRLFPKTHEVLYSEHAVTENYPEDTLLPDYAAMERERNEAVKQHKWESVPIRKIKKTKLDMARKQFKLGTPVAPAPPVGQDNQEDVRISAAFAWKTKQIDERNSVYSQPHGAVDFAQARNAAATIDTASVRDDSTTGTSVKYYLDGQQSVSLVPALTEGQTVQASLSSYGDMPSDLCYSDEFASDYALRSNFLSEGSGACNKLVRVKMERYRKVKKLTGKHVKGLSLESRATQQKRRDIQQIRKYMRPGTT